MEPPTEYHGSTVAAEKLAAWNARFWMSSAYWYRVSGEKCDKIGNTYQATIKGMVDVLILVSSCL